MSLRRYPSNKDVYNSLGQVYILENKMEAAKEMFKIAIALEPKFGIAHFNLALLSSKLNNSKEAIYHLKEAIKLGTRSPMVSKLAKLYKIQK